MNLNLSYKEKYLKYKLKYMELKKNNKNYGHIKREDHHEVKKQPVKLTEDDKVILKKIQRKGKLLSKYQQYEDNDVMVNAAIKNNGLALEFASQRLRNDKDIILTAVKQNGLAIKFALDHITDNDIITTILTNEKQKENIIYYLKKFN